MKRHLASLSLGAVLTVLALASAAWAQAEELIARVPFAFEMNGKEMPAGIYVFNTMKSEVALAVKNRDTGETRFVLTQRYTVLRGDARPHVVFHRYGDTLLLSGTWNGSGAGNTLRQTKREKELLSEANKPETVLILAAAR